MAHYPNLVAMLEAMGAPAKYVTSCSFNFAVNKAPTAQVTHLLLGPDNRPTLDAPDKLAEACRECVLVPRDIFDTLPDSTKVAVNAAWHNKPL